MPTPQIHDVETDTEAMCTDSPICLSRQLLRLCCIPTPLSDVETATEAMYSDTLSHVETATEFMYSGSPI